MTIKQKLYTHTHTQRQQRGFYITPVISRFTNGKSKSKISSKVYKVAYPLLLFSNPSASYAWYVIAVAQDVN